MFPWIFLKRKTIGGKSVNKKQKRKRLAGRRKSSKKIRLIVAEDIVIRSRFKINKQLKTDSACSTEPKRCLFILTYLDFKALQKAETDHCGYFMEFELTDWQAGWLAAVRRVLNEGVIGFSIFIARTGLAQSDARTHITNDDGMQKLEQSLSVVCVC